MVDFTDHLIGGQNCNSIEITIGIKYSQGGDEGCDYEGDIYGEGDCFLIE